jgi:hypothetical protein
MRPVCWITELEGMGYCQKAVRYYYFFLSIILSVSQLIA